jgi:cytochrome c6
LHRGLSKREQHQFPCASSLLIDRSCWLYVTRSLDELAKHVHSTVSKLKCAIFWGTKMESTLFRIGSILISSLLLSLGAPIVSRAQNDAAATFKAKCAVCHGANGDGSTNVGKSMKMRDLRSADVQKQTDAELNTIVCCGKGKMPAYQGKLTDEQIKQQVAYMRTLAKTP